MSTYKLTLVRGRMPTWPHPDDTVDHKLTLEWADAGASAWRGRYLYLNGRMVFRLVVDPNNGIKPTLSADVGLGGGKMWGFRAILPWMRWRPNMGPVRSRAYKVVSIFWHNMDGRFGWGTEASGIPMWGKEK